MLGFYTSKTRRPPDTLKIRLRSFSDVLATQKCIQLKKGLFKLRTAVGRDKLWCATSSNPVLQESGDSGVGVTVDQREDVHHRVNRFDKY